MAGAVGFRVKSFWNSKGVQRQKDRRQKRMLMRFGAFVRTRARSLLNKSGGKKNVVSMAGQPPRKHKGTLRRHVFFAFDPSVPSVVIGPIIVSGVAGSGKTLRSLEEGGITSGREIIKTGGGRGEGGRFLKVTTRLGKKLTFRIKSHAYMQPAFTEEQSNISSIWRSS